MCDGRDDVCEVSKRPSPSTRIVTGREKIREGGEKMPDMEKVEKLTSILEERSGLDVREALVRFYNYLSSEETRIFDKETDYLLDTLGVEIELPF